MLFLTNLLCFFFLMATAFAVRDYQFDIYFENRNAPYDVCTMTEVDDFYGRITPIIISIFGDPKYDLKPMKDTDWKKVVPGKPNRKERVLSFNCDYYCPWNSYMCYDVYHCAALGYRHLRGERALTEAEVTELKGNVEGAARGLINQFSKASPYSTTCTQALLAATIGSSLTIL